VVNSARSETRQNRTVTGTYDSHGIAGFAAGAFATRRRAGRLDLGVSRQILQGGLIGQLAGGGFQRRTLFFVTATGEGNVERGAEKAELLVQRVEMLISPLDRPLEGAMGQFNCVPEQTNIEFISVF